MLVGTATGLQQILLESLNTNLKILFICSRNRRRSLTAETIYHRTALISVRSAGTQPQARIVVTPGLINWADAIVCMEKSHVNRLRTKYSELLSGKQVVTIHIPDDYEFMQPELVDDLRTQMDPLIQLWLEELPPPD